VEEALRDWEVPGAAIVVVKGGKVVYKKTYGLRTYGDADKVDSKTLFACASTTKAMTATCMGILVDEGKVHWDDLVSKYLADFQLHDPYISQNLRIRDLFTHNTGVGNTDFLWASMDIPSKEILYRMRFVEPSYPLRGGYTYQNIFYLAAGQVIERVSGVPWAEFLREKVLSPLGMVRTFPLLSEVPDANRVSPHLLVRDTLRVIDPMSADAIGPAGSVQSCIDDLSLWTITMLDSSKYEGGTLLSASTWMELFTPQVIIPMKQFYPTAQLTTPHWTSYGLGWFQQDYRGHKINYHTGSLPGEIAMHGQLPEHQLGVFIVGNLDHAEVRHALLFRAFDQFALGIERDWNAEFRELYQKLTVDYKIKIMEAESARILKTQPSGKAQEYVGTYQSPLYGTIDITLNEDDLRFSINNKRKGILGHWNYDTFRANWENIAYAEGLSLLSFERNQTGIISTIKMDGQVFYKKTN
jgi:CubicO group peptidase (beta-lactamase class C family)